MSFKRQTSFFFKGTLEVPLKGERENTLLFQTKTDWLLGLLKSKGFNFPSYGMKIYYFGHWRSPRE